MDELTRRRLLVGVSGVFLLGLTGCGDDDGGEAQPTPEPVPTTRFIDTAMGPVEIPTKPTRVVSVDARSTATLFELGLKPVAVREVLDGQIADDHLAAYNATPKIGGASGELKLEVIASMAPDLIVGKNDSQTPYEQLKGIAATAVFAGAAKDWPVLAESYADAVNEKATIATLQKRFDDRAAQIRSTYATVLAQNVFYIVYPTATGFWLYYSNSQPGKVVTAAGVKLGRNALDKPDFDDMSPEKTDLLGDANALIIPSQKSASAAVTSYLKGPLFQSLPAAKADHVFEFVNIFPTSWGTSLQFLNDLGKMLETLKSA